MPATMEQLLEAGCHFGHQHHRWNPKMADFIYTERGGVHIIDLGKTLAALEEAERFAKEVASQGRQILFIGTKRQAAPVIRDEAERAGQPYVAERWLGGMLTNFRTIRERVRYLEQLESAEASGELESRYTKKEFLKLSEEKEKLQKTLSGIKQMTALPGAVFIVDIGRESIAVKEARALGIPVIAVVDTNANPELADYPVPANDDAIRSIRLIVSQIAEAALAGKSTFESQQAQAEAEEVSA